MTPTSAAPPLAWTPRTARPTARARAREAARRRPRVDPFTWAAVALTLVGAVLRLVTILKFPWDQDELYTIAEARDLFHTRIAPGIDARPLYYLLEHPLLGWLPQTPAMLRLLPFVFGVAGLWVTWLAGRRSVGRVGGLVALFLATVSTWHMEVSGQARYYSLTYLCAALVLLWLPEACDSERPSRYLAALAALALGTLTHPSFVFPVIGIVVAVAVVAPNGRLQSPWPRPSAWRWLWGPFLGFLSLFMGALQLAHRQSAVRNSVGRGTAATLRLAPAMAEWITPVVCGAAIVGAICLLRSERSGLRRLGMIGLLAAGTTVGGLVGASLWTAIYAVYATALLPVVFVIAGAAAQAVADAILSPRRDGQVAALAMGLLGIGVAPATLSHLSDGSRFDYRPAFRQIEREGPRVAVVTWPDVIAAAYAPNLTRLSLRPDSAYLGGLLAIQRDLWVVASVKRAGIALDDSGELAAWLGDRCRRRGVHEGRRFDYRIYRVELYRCTAGAAPR